MSIRDRVEEWLFEALQRRRRRGSFVVDAEIERGEERRVERLMVPGYDDMDRERGLGWRPPPGAFADEWRPRSTLGPLP